MKNKIALAKHLSERAKDEDLINIVPEEWASLFLKYLVEFEEAEENKSVTEDKDEI